MSRLLRIALIVAAVSLLLRLAGTESTESPSPSYPPAVDERAAAAIMEVADGFIRAGLTRSPSVDWTRWATSRLTAEFADFPLRDEATVHVRAVDVRVLRQDDRQASVGAEFSVLRDGSLVPVALVLHLVATPLGWRVDRVGR